MTALRQIIFITVLCCITNKVVAELTAKPPECIHQGEELWPHINPNFYWYCKDKGAIPKQMVCAEDRGFLRIENEVSGCIPYSAWKCTTKVNPPSCEGDNKFKPHRHENSNKFWACTEDEPGVPSRPVPADCLDFPIINGTVTKGTRGFVDNEHNLGCVPWDLWVCDQADDKNRE